MRLSALSIAGRWRGRMRSGPRCGDFCGVIARSGPDAPWDEVVVGLDRMAPPDPALGPRWFTGARLNFAENLLRFADEREALVFWNEQGRQRALTYRELVTPWPPSRRALRAHGIRPGDRVAGFLPNLPETVIAMLATASLGAIWSSCSPDFGANGVLDRFGQIEPRSPLLRRRLPLRRQGDRLAGAGARGVRADPGDRAGRGGAVPAWTPGLVGHTRSDAVGGVGGGRSDGRASAPGRRPPTARPSDRRPPPLRPSALHHVLAPAPRASPSAWSTAPAARCCSTSRSWCSTPISRRDDRIFYFTTCGWMMWNWLVSSLAVGATVVLLRRRAARAGADPVGHGGAGAGHRLRDQREVPGAGGEGGAASRLGRTTSRRSAPSSRPAARWRRSSFDYVYRDVKRGRPSRQHQRRHRHHLLLRPRQSDRPGLAGRAADARAGDGGRGVRRGRTPSARAGR